MGIFGVGVHAVLSRDCLLHGAVIQAWDSF